MRRFLLAASLLTALVGCSDLGETPPPAIPATRLSLTPVTFEQLPGWAADRHGAVLPAFLKSCRRIESRPLDQPLDTTGVAGIVTDWQPACAAARGLDPANHAAVRYFFESYFTPYLAAGDNNPNGLFTGYYEAELHGSRRPSKRYHYPIYAAPEDLAAVKQSGGGKYHTRAQIAGGALKGRGLELLWVDDPVDAFFLSVQGSGRVAMDDGSVVRVGYAGDNGHEYKSIGRELIARGIIPRERLSMDSIRAWITDNPERGAHLMLQNPRYIFFRIVPGQDGGPIGAAGVPLTAERSLAVDKRYVPYNIPLWLDTVTPLAPDTPFQKLMMTQDTGSAITGPVRGDIFFGFGETAANRAGNMKATGQYYLLLPQRVTRPIS